MVEVTSNRFGCMEITQLNMLYEKHSVVSMNGIVEIAPNVTFRILISNYGLEHTDCQKGKQLVTLHKKQG